MSEAVVWLIILAPLAASAAIGLVVRPFFNERREWAAPITIAGVAVSFILSLWALAEVAGQSGALDFTPHEWLSIGPLTVNAGLYLDSLAAIMVVVVGAVSLLVQVYSIGYMRGEPGYARYFALMALFTAAMQGLVLSRNIVQTYVFWELVGVCSYLLIGFWHDRPAAARAAMKAFIVTRIGDLGFLLAIVYLFFHQDAFAARGLNALEIPDIHTAVGLGVLGGAAATWIAIGLFAGAVGKSAQFPLHTWLPDAMEGPTPVSALIHAATMVAAGVFLVARFFPLFEASEAAMHLVALIGGGTAVFAASMAMAAKDIKRVIAYSTMSQLGFMMLALGVGAYAAAIFHLFNHAFFKALLFLAAGSVGQAAGTFNMDFLGGMGRRQRWTTATFLVAALSLAGLFPLAGFWSKDGLLSEALHVGDPVALLVLALGLVATAMTGLYIFRAFLLTFTGSYRGGAAAEEAARRGAAPPPADTQARLGESRLAMLGPMVVLAVLAAVLGLAANPPGGHWFSRFLVPPGGSATEVHFNIGIAVLSVGLGLAGAGAAWAFYGRSVLFAERGNVTPLQRFLHQLLARCYYVDDLYEGVIAGRLFRAGCGVLAWLDRNLVDGLAEMVGWFGRNLGRAVSQLQTGQLQAYGMAMGLGVLVVVIVFLVWG
ncbi:MAG: NADH-quinone oxidoreductase subunit L [Dehalococcoidia bacterium]|nr:NADH-quinone oxidoreductase subunit L [Dehalococcoidia bacterium]